MLNHIWVTMVLLALIGGGLTGRLEAVGAASQQGAIDAVSMALGLVGVMTFWLGLVEVLQAGGLMRLLSGWLRPVMARLFPDVPASHPAMSTMILSMTANILGLGNAATPLGIRAMQQLDRLNPHPGSLTNAMALFLAITTSGLAVVPTNMIALRASLGSREPGAIVLTTLISTLIATAVAILMAKLLAPLWPIADAELMPDSAGPQDGTAEEAPQSAAKGALGSLESTRLRPPQKLLSVLLTLAVALAFLYDLGLRIAGHRGSGAAGWGPLLSDLASTWPLLLMVVGVVLFGVLRGVDVYAAMVAGGRAGMTTAVDIMPYLVTMLAAIAMLRAAGVLDLAVTLLRPMAEALGIPSETLPMALLRPLTGSGSLAVAADTMRVHGPDSRIGQIVSTMLGSTETTFYILAIYCGAVRTQRTRHAILACLMADVCGLLAAAWTCRLLLTPS